MTLVVARSLPSQLRILSDTKITDVHAVRSGPLYGALKAVIIDPHLTVCFAGNAGRAQAAIEEVYTLRRAGKTVEEVTACLGAVSRAGDTDFIVATLSPGPALYRVHNGQVEGSMEACWIGDLDAFAAYQEMFHSLPPIPVVDSPPDYSIIAQMGAAFNQLLVEERCGSVQGPQIGVMSTAAGFEYVPQAVAFFGRQTLPPGQWTRLRFGSAADGGYAYSIYIPREAGIGAVGVFFLQGNFGALFYPARHPSPILYRDVSQDQFRDAILNEFGIEISGIGLS